LATQAAPARQSARPIAPSPSQSRGPIASGQPPSPRPPTELETLLPNFAGAGYLEKRPIAPDDLNGPGSNAIQTRVFNRVFATLDRESIDLEGAIARGPITMIAMRIKGVTGTSFADAYAGATLAEAPGGTLKMATVGGRYVRRIHWADGSFPSDLHLLVDGEVVIVVGAHPDQQAVVDNVLATMFEPKLEIVLPAELLGRPTSRFSFPAASISATGDICSMVCPGEPQKLAAELGVSMDTMDLAIAYLNKPPSVTILAVRVPGADDQRLVDARIAETDRADDPAFARTPAKIAGKRVTWVRYGPFPSPDQRELLYAHGGVLFVVHPAPDSAGGPVTAEVAAAFAALP
jgi:hypothetical protein